MVVVNHTYMTLEMFSKPVVGGGTGSYYSADNIFIIGRQQEQQTVAGKKETVGYNFIINVEKSRYVREKSKIPVTVLHEGGISKWSGLLDLAEESGHLSKGKIGASIGYSIVNRTTGEVEEKKYRVRETENSAFWLPILKDQEFQKFIEDKYCVSHGDIILDEDTTSDVYNDIEEDDE